MNLWTVLQFTWMEAVGPPATGSDMLKPREENSYQILSKSSCTVGDCLAVCEKIAKPA